MVKGCYLLFVVNDLYQEEEGVSLSGLQVHRVMATLNLKTKVKSLFSALQVRNTRFSVCLGT